MERLHIHFYTQAGSIKRDFCILEGEAAFDPVIILKTDDRGKLVCQGSEAAEPIICGGNAFIPSGSSEVLSPGLVLQFYAYNGQCRMVSVGSRIYQKS